MGFSFGNETVDVQEFKFVYLKAIEKCPAWIRDFKLKSDNYKLSIYFYDEILTKFNFFQRCKLFSLSGPGPMTRTDEIEKLNSRWVLKFIFLLRNTFRKFIYD